MDHFYEKSRKCGGDILPLVNVDSACVGKSKVSWSGIENPPPPTVPQFVGEPYDWKLARQKVEGEDVLLCPAHSDDLQLDEADGEVLRILVDLVKEGKEEEVQEEVQKLLDGNKDSRERVLTFATNCPDFREGRAKGVTGTLIKALMQKHTNDGQTLPQLPFPTMDYVFFKFFQQPNAATLKNAFASFDLTKHKLRYSRAIVDLASNGDYKGACHAAVALFLWDFFPIEIFCLPLLLQDKLSIMESYLAKSPESCKKVITYLDGFHEQTDDKITALCSLYPKIRPIGASKLAKKPLDKLIKRYATAWGLSPSYYPLSVARRASVDLAYWVRQRYASGGQHSLTLVNWRELLETKVGEKREMQVQLVEELMKHDMGEALYWNNLFHLNLFPPNAVSTAAPRVPVPDKNPTNAEGYYELRLSANEIIFVDTPEAYVRFLKDVETQTQVGVDAEFMSSTSSEQKISLLQVKSIGLLDYSMFFANQIATKNFAYLLDFESLPSALTAAQMMQLASVVFLNPAIRKVGFGLAGDLRMLSKSNLPGMEKLAERSKAVLNLDKARGRLASLLALPPTTERGLSGFCHIVLGKPLCKVDQISDWSRRPLRPSQVEEL